VVRIQNKAHLFVDLHPRVDTFVDLPDEPLSSSPVLLPQTLNQRIFGVFLLIIGRRVPLDRQWKQAVPPRESPLAGGPPLDLLQERRESRGLQPLQVPHRRRRRQAPPDMARTRLQEGVFPLSSSSEPSPTSTTRSRHSSGAGLQVHTRRVKSPAGEAVFHELNRRCQNEAVFVSRNGVVGL
jgi:hypothetical protein